MVTRTGKKTRGRKLVTAPLMLPLKQQQEAQISGHRGYSSQGAAAHMEKGCVTLITAPVQQVILGAFSNNNKESSVKMVTVKIIDFPLKVL